jgi:hypothetical protein
LGCAEGLACGEDLACAVRREPFERFRLAEVLRFEACVDVGRDLAAGVAAGSAAGAVSLVAAISL